MEKQGIKTEVYDVIVAGGGVAGVAAAVSAAKCGASVLLIEKTCNLGGLATNGLISWYEPICNGLGEKIMASLSEEFAKIAIKNGYDTLDKRWGGRRERKNMRYCTFFSPAFFALSLTEYCLENGVKIRYDTLITRPVTEGNKVIGLECESVSGKEFFAAKVIIDCTGTAIVCERAGMPTEDGENYFVFISHECTLSDAEKAVAEQDIGKIRNWKNAAYEPGPATRYQYPPEIVKVKGTGAEDETEWMLKGQIATLKRYENTDKDSRELLGIPAMPQYRTIRRIKGAYEFIGLGDKNGDKRIIGRTNDVARAGVTHLLPYGCLYNPDFPNLLAAGRIISAVGNGWDITRIIPVCVLTGQTAGIAAVHSIRENRAVGEIDYSALKAELEKENVTF